MPSTGDPSDRPAKPRSRGVYEQPKGSGIWWILYYDQTGHRHREKIGPKSLATQVYTKRKNEIAERRFFPERLRQRDVPVFAYLQEFMAEHVIGRLRNAKHYEQYRARWAAALKGKGLRQVLPEDVSRYAAKRRAAGKAPATINRELSFLRRAFNVAIKNQKADRNPVTADLFAKENNQRVRFLSPEEEQGLQTAMRPEDWALVAVAMHTGMRRSEQFSLRWDNIDFGVGIITIPRSKSGETRRIAMNETVREILRALPGRLKGEWVFPSGTGTTPIDGQNFSNRVFLKALRQAKVIDFSWHCLRHTFASRLVMKGVDLRTVQELLGHKTVTMTLRYSHLSPAHQMDAVRRLDAAPADAPTATTTATKPKRSKVLAGGGLEVFDFPTEKSGDAQNRTADLGIMRPSL